MKTISLKNFKIKKERPVSSISAVKDSLLASCETATFVNFVQW